MKGAVEGSGWGDRPGRVYFVQAGEGGLIKIGVAGDAARRILNLCSASSVTLTLLALLPGDRATETALHGRLWAHRHHGEWFNPTREVFACIEEAKRHPQIVPKQLLRQSGRRRAAAMYAAERWKIDEDTAFDVVASHRRIANAVDSGRFREADRLILEMLAKLERDPVRVMTVDDFNEILRRYGTHFRPGQSPSAPSR